MTIVAVFVAVFVYLLVGVGAAMTARSWEWNFKIGLLFMWPLALGFWLGERCEDNSQAHPSAEER